MSFDPKFHCTHHLHSYLLQQAPLKLVNWFHRFEHLKSCKNKRIKLLYFTPVGGGYFHMSANIICLYYTQWPSLSLQPAPNDPFFQNFNINFKFLVRIFKNSSIFSWKGESSLKFETKKTTANDPLFWEFHTTKVQFFVDPTPNDSLFSTKSYTECPLFLFSGRHIPVTFIFLSASPGI